MTVFDDNHETTALLCRTCGSSAEILREMGLTKNGAMYRQLKAWALKHDIELPTGKTRRPTTLSISSRFVEHSTLGNKEAKRYLLEKLNWTYECMEPDCPSPSPEWAGRALSLQLDHINGINTDFRLSNLRFLCPNCHSQTVTYGSKNHKRAIVEHLCVCGGRKSRQASQCKVCTDASALNKGHKIDWPEIDTLIASIRASNYSQLGRELGVSGNTIRQHLRRRGVDPRTLIHIGDPDEL